VPVDFVSPVPLAPFSALFSRASLEAVLDVRRDHESHLVTFFGAQQPCFWVARQSLRAGFLTFSENLVPPLERVPAPRAAVLVVEGISRRRAQAPVKASCLEMSSARSRTRCEACGYDGSLDGNVGALGLAALAHLGIGMAKTKEDKEECKE